MRAVIRSIEKGRKKRKLDQGMYLVRVNEYGHAKAIPVSQSEVADCIVKIGREW